MLEVRLVGRLRADEQLEQDHRGGDLVQELGIGVRGKLASFDSSVDDDASDVTLVFDHAVAHAVRELGCCAHRSYGTGHQFDVFARDAVRDGVQHGQQVPPQ